MNEIERVARAIWEQQCQHWGRYRDMVPDLCGWDDLTQSKQRELLKEAAAAIAAMRGEPVRKYPLGDRLTKTKGSAWTGRVVGFYSTSLTPVGYAIESENEPGSVQIYPEAALQPASGKAGQ